MEVGYGKKGSSSPSWPSRLSASAQPFTMNRYVGQLPALNSLTSSSHEPLTPAPSNHLDDSDDTLLLNSIPNLNFEDHLQPVSASTYSRSALQSDSTLLDLTYDDFPDFAGESSFLKYPFASLQGYCDSSSLARESLLEQDSKLTSSKVSTTSDVLSSSMLQNIPQAPMFGSSATGTDFSPSSHILSMTRDFTSNCVVNNFDTYPGRNLSCKRELCDHDKSLVEKGKEIIDGKSVSRTSSDLLVMEKSEPEVTSADDFVLENSGTMAGICTKSSSKMLDENESDLDSPCWKGLQNSKQSPSGVSESFNLLSLVNESEAGSSLNPQAPQFFPSRAKGSGDYFKNNYVGDCFSSFPEDEYSNFNVSYKEQQVMDTYKAGPEPPGLSNAAGLKPPGLSNATGYPLFNGIHKVRKESAMLKHSKRSYALSSSQMAKPCLDDRVFTSKSMAVTEVNVEGFVDGTKDSVHNSPVNMSVFAMGHIPNLSSSEVGALNDFSEILQFLSQSLSKCPKINVAIIVNVIHYLSELLVQNCSNDLDSLNEHEHEMIRQIINNLYVLIKHRVGEKTPMLDLAHTGSLDYPAKSTAIHEGTAKGLVVHRELDRRSDHEWQNSYRHVSNRNMKDVGSSSRDVDSGRGNSIIPMQVFRRAMKESHLIGEEIHPEALLNLWLEAEGALCSMKYENYVLRRKLAEEGCKSEER